MIDFIQIISAWVAVIICAVLLSKIIFRLVSKNKKNKMTVFNAKMRNPHVYLGISLIYISFLHGVLSGDNVFTLNLGTITLILFILLFLSFALRKLIKKIIPWQLIHIVLAVLSIAVMIWHIIDIGQFRIFDVFSGTLSEKNINDIEDSLKGEVEGFGKRVKLKDGKFKGEGEGYGGPITVEIEIKDNKVINVDILDHNEQNEWYYGEALISVPKRIIEKQDFKVDVETGATYTSMGIMKATRDALTKALVKGELNPEVVRW